MSDLFAPTPCAAGCVRGHGERCHARTARVPRFCELIGEGRGDYGRLVDRLTTGVDPPPPTTFLFTGGLGDVLVLEAWMSDDDRRRCRSILWAAPGSPRIAEVVDAIPALAGRAHAHLWSDFSAAGRRAFYSLADVAATVADPRLGSAEDWSTSAKFPAFERGESRWGGSSLLRRPGPDVARFGLPPRFVAICPETNSTHRLDRFFAPAEWGWILSYLDRTGGSAVVLNGPGAAPPPGHPRLLDLSGRTTFPEAVEVVRRADGYLGVDSALSVIAAEALPPHRFAVRSTIDFVRRWQHVCYPRTAGHVVVRRDLRDFGAWPRDPLAAYRRGAGADDRLEYCPERGVARLREAIGEPPYDAAYFAKYRDYRDTKLGIALNDFRVGLAAKYAGGSGGILDVGIGAGTFLDRLGEGRPRWGYDVNPAGVAWLRERGLWHDPYGGLPECCRVVTAWDVIEHLEWPGELLGSFPDGTHVIISLPVFDDLARITESKHFRPIGAEHRWYWTRDGLTNYLADLGYERAETSWRETELGRESILTAVFRKGPKRRGNLAQTIAPPPGKR